MELVVDLHVHSHYSMATSRNCTLEGLYFWGKKKGINIIGTGDFTHPKWLEEISTKLELSEGGLYTLKADIASEIDKTLPASVRSNLLRFIPTVEIATVYKKLGRTRKLHQLIVMPTLEAAERLDKQLARIGNLAADGRPMLGLDAKQLLEFSLLTDSDSLYVPAHIWTPWFGLFGSKSGFDSLIEAYDELAPEIHAVETGLSSDSPMNWRLKQLDGVTMVSNSDAHSPLKLGREATIMEADPTYADVIGAIKTNDRRLVGTIEFFPEEGKYYADGHRACGIKFTPEQTIAHGGICPKCGKPLVVGVNYRIGQLADRRLGAKSAPKKVEYIVPLTEVIAEISGVKSASGKAVQLQYEALLAALGSEFDILRTRPIEELAVRSPDIAAAIASIRTGNVFRETGFDGVYGQIKVLKHAGTRGKRIAV